MFENPVLGVHHVIRASGHALIFLTDHWRWRRAGAYHDAVRICLSAFESDRGHEDARDAMLAALISAGLVPAGDGGDDQGAAGQKGTTLRPRAERPRRERPPRMG
ncbi:DUF982 domain-containing protein [Falsirhodobacter sp. 20TX0035]|uniref:DUF982 domain-containing protein n=1 Tax=Falsirhodobacter sp. 20TX0035 TaxID=3022019 RepID=UPI003FA54F8C